jgi:hypothetical protein
MLKGYEFMLDQVLEDFMMDDVVSDGDVVSSSSQYDIHAGYLFLTRSVLNSKHSHAIITINELIQTHLHCFFIKRKLVYNSISSPIIVNIHEERSAAGAYFFVTAHIPASEWMRNCECGTEPRYRNKCKKAPHNSVILSGK